MTRTPRPGTPCDDMNCVADRQEFAVVRRILTPALQPGGSPVDALMFIIDQAKLNRRARDQYRAALTRVASLYVQGDQNGGTVRTDALCRAMFVRDEEIPENQ